jgi:penicillin-binding protein 1A
VVDPEPLPERYPAYLSAVRAWLEAHYPPEIVHGAGLVVTAGIDLQAQLATEQVFEQKTRELDKRVRKASSQLQSAGVLLDSENGRLLAIWGGVGLDSSGFNRATQALRQAGSSFKPLVYALAFSQPPLPNGAPRFTASSLEPNEPRHFEGAGNWMPRNAEWEQSPTASLAEGLIWSRNIATASLLEDLGGPDRLIEFAGKLGFDKARLPHEMGLALGQGEVTVLQMAQLTAAISNGGWRIEGSPVLRIADYRGQEVLGAPKRGERS